MKNYLITVESQSKMNHIPVKSERFACANPDYAKGVHRGLKLAYPDNEVYLEEIKN